MSIFKILAIVSCFMIPPYCSQTDNKDCSITVTASFSDSDCTVVDPPCDRIVCRVHIKEGTQDARLQFSFSSCINLTGVCYNDDSLSGHLMIETENNERPCSPSENNISLICNQASVCITSLTVVNSGAGAGGRDGSFTEIEFYIGQDLNSTCTMATMTTMTDDDSIISQPNGADKTPTMQSSTTTTEETTILAPTHTTGTEQSDITSTIIGAAGAIAALLFIIAIAIIGLILVLLVRKKNSSPMDSTPFDHIEFRPGNESINNTSSYATMDATPTNHFMNVGAALPIETGIDDFSLPVPPMDPGLVTLAEWRRRENMSNPFYASTLSIANQSEPPEYEAIQDVRRQYLLEKGSSDVLQSDETNRGSCAMPGPGIQATIPTYTESTQGEIGLAVSDGNRETLSATNRTLEQLDEEEENECSSSSPPTNSITAENFLYGSFEDFSAKFIRDGGGTLSKDHSVHNDLYDTIAGAREASQSQHGEDLHATTLATEQGALPEDHSDPDIQGASKGMVRPQCNHFGENECTASRQRGSPLKDNHDQSDDKGIKSQSSLLGRDDHYNATSLDQEETDAQDQTVDNTLYENANACKGTFTSQYSLIGEDLHMAGDPGLSSISNADTLQVPPSSSPSSFQSPSELVRPDSKSPPTVSPGTSSTNVAVENTPANAQERTPAASDPEREEFDFQELDQVRPDHENKRKDSLYSKVNKKHKKTEEDIEDIAPPIPPYHPDTDSPEHRMPAGGLIASTGEKGSRFSIYSDDILTVSEENPLEKETPSNSISVIEQTERD